MEESAQPNAHNDPMSRWWVYAQHIQEINIGRLNFTAFQYQQLLESKKIGPLATNLRRIYLNLGEPPATCVSAETESPQNLQAEWDSWSGPDQGEPSAAILAVMLLSRQVDTFHFGCDARIFPSVQHILKQAPHLTSFGMHGTVEPWYHTPQVLDNTITTWFSDDQETPKMLGLSEPRDPATILAIPIGTPLSHGVTSLTISGWVAYELGRNLCRVAQCLPGLQTLIVHSCPLYFGQPVETPEQWEHDNANNFPSLAKVQLVQVNVELVLCLFGLKGILKRLTSIYWESVMDSEAWEGVVAREMYTEVVDLISQRADNLVSFSLSTPNLVQAPEVLEELRTITSSGLTTLRPVEALQAEVQTWGMEVV